VTTREKILTGIVGVLAVAGVGGVGGYIGLVKPIFDKRQQARMLEQETADLRLKLGQIRKDLTRLPAAHAKSLPPDLALAKQEYEAALSRILREAKVPRGYTVVPGQPDSRPVPELDPKTKTPAYQRIVFVISMKPVGLDTLTDFLERYHKLGLLHQITRLTIKRPETQAATGSRRSNAAADRADLDVTLTTEAIILDGVEPRRTLRPVPYAPGALVGSAGYHHLTQTPDLGRTVPTPPPTSTLATMAREYVAMLAKNPFHGPLPPPPPPPAPRVEPPPEPLEDISAFVKLNAIIRSSDGRVRADIKDTANNLDYHIDLWMKDGKPVVKVEKFYFLKDRKKKLDGGTELHISDDTSSTERKFKVVGVDTNGTDLVLTASVAPSPPPDSRDRSTSRSGSRSSVPVSAAIAGGTVVGLPQERVYIWPVGQSLKGVKELSPAEGAKVVQRVRDEASGEAATLAAPVTATAVSQPVVDE
jgi:hypothetical protein